MVLDRQAFDKLVDQVYRASTGEVGWQPTLRAIAEAFDASFAWLALERSDLSQIRQSPSEVNPEPVAVHMSADLSDLAELYFKHYHRLDPFRPQMQLACAPTVMQLHAVCDPKEFVRSEYYQDFARRADSFHLTRFSARFDAKLQLTFEVNRSASGQPLNETELERFESLSNHIVRALKVERHITQMGATMDAAFDALEQIGRAAFLVDRNGRVVRMNALAEAISVLADGVSIRNQRLIIEAPRGQQLLRQALQAHLGEGSTEMPREAAVIAVERPSGSRPYLVEVTPFEFESYWNTGVAATALVTIRDPDVTLRPKTTRNWGRALGLTRSEWRVARTLVVSRDEGEVAQTLGISLNTVKTHRKRIYAKLGIHRRAELSAMLPGTG
ncbi:helix-turn-helix transcriptional regulator [Pelagibius marinus]|uniref:helix-turn-helix transcriptional regulator n=1 Tax=Pelagibius marinus TaxID=2762760 RepID=UPI0018731066|nr:helix-turn-helix transcriptional regulator [Pelagibius marinus]